MARHKLTGIIAAVKIISKAKMKTSEQTANLLKQEIEVVQQIEHPCIMRVLEVLEDFNFFYIVTELLEEELSKRLQSRGMFTERDAAVIF